MTCCSVPVIMAVAVAALVHVSFGLVTPSTASVPEPRAPHLIELRRESVPVMRAGKVASFKTSYSGIINVGLPAQEFRVVFDTGSGHLVLPAIECQSEACLVHQRYDMQLSTSATAINADGSPVKPGDDCDQVTIGFGTGEVTGEFVKDRVCIGSIPEYNKSQEDPIASQLCVDLQVVMAVEMSTHPFKSFGFDGIMGMGLDALALSKDFSFFSVLSGSDQRLRPHFGVFLTDGEFDDEISEIALGGINPSRALEPLAWVPVMMPEEGHWLVEVVALRIGGQTMDVCRDGTCRAVVDTGTSHLGVPGADGGSKQVEDLLTTLAGDLLDCRLAVGPTIELELPGFTITLGPENYMRRLPLRDGVEVGSKQGVTLESANDNGEASSTSATESISGDHHAGGNATPAVTTAIASTDCADEDCAGAGVGVGGAVTDPGAVALLETYVNRSKYDAGTDSTNAHNASLAFAGGAASVDCAPADCAGASVGVDDAITDVGAVALPETEVVRRCSPRTMSVNLPAPMGPKLFILGEPVLHRYYTVYDWSGPTGQPRVGFGLAANRRNTGQVDLSGRGSLPKGLDSDMEFLLMQKSLKTVEGTVDGHEEQVGMWQVTILMTRVRSRLA